MTNPANTFARQDWDLEPMQIGSPGSIINAGDALAFTIAGSTIVVQPITALDTAFVGVSQDTNPITSIGPVKVGAGWQGGVPPSYGDITAHVIVLRSGAFKFFTSSGETYFPGDAVYTAADTAGNNSQTVSKVASVTTGPRPKIGIVDPGGIVQNGGPVAGGAGVSVQVFVQPNWP